MLKLGRPAGIRLSKFVKDDVRLYDISSKNPVTCRTSQSLKAVLPSFAQKYRRLPVLDSGGALKGILSATDILRVLGGWGRFRKKSPRERAGVKVSGMMSKDLLTLDVDKSLPDVLSFFREHRFGSYPVTRKRELVGIVSEWDVVRQIRGKTGIRVLDVMVKKPLVADEKYSIHDVAKILCMGGFRRLPVVKKGILIGIVTPRDILRYLHENKAVQKLEKQNGPVRDVMEKNVVSVGRYEDVFEAVQIMVSKKIGGITVTEDQELLGIITERDIVDATDF
jgi:CBS domain-containing protein